MQASTGVPDVSTCCGRVNTHHGDKLDAMQALRVGRQPVVRGRHLLRAPDGDHGPVQQTGPVAADRTVQSPAGTACPHPATHRTLPHHIATCTPRPLDAGTRSRAHKADVCVACHAPVSEADMAEDGDEDVPAQRLERVHGLLHPRALAVHAVLQCRRTRHRRMCGLMSGPRLRRPCTVWSERPCLVWEGVLTKRPTAFCLSCNQQSMAKLRVGKLAAVLCSKQNLGQKASQSPALLCTNRLQCRQAIHVARRQVGPSTVGPVASPPSEQGWC